VWFNVFWLLYSGALAGLFLLYGGGTRRLLRSFPELESKPAGGGGGGGGAGPAAAAASPTLRQAKAVGAYARC
jgi:hypothetical protein